MKILFIHQNFPGQFKHLAPTLAADSTNQIVALTMRKESPKIWEGVRLFLYGSERGTTPNIHPWVSDFETKVIRGEAALRAGLKLRAEGFEPELIIAHPGWGESLFIKQVWPNAKIGIYCEFFYHAQGADVGFDAEFASNPLEDICRLRLKNINNLLHIDHVDAGISPTQWQASTFPFPFRERITVIHDGIDTDVVTPAPNVNLTLNNNRKLTRSDEIITFVNRNLEPYRGYHIFMRALPEIMRRRPNARVLIVGGDEVSYGARPPAGKGNWKSIFLEEVRENLDMARIHFLGRIPYPQFIALLQLSTVHVYLTYPFVLSWSLLEAMSVGCAIVASDTTPLHEAIRDRETGRLFDFFSPAQLSSIVCELLGNPSERQRLGKNARSFAKENYDLKSRCLPRQLSWVRSLITAQT